MKNILLFLSLFIPLVAFAQDDISQSPLIGNGRYQGAKSYDGQLTIPVLGVDSSTNTEVNAISGKEVHLSVAKTPIAKVLSTGLTLTTGDVITGAGGYVRGGVYVPTAAATPVTGTNLCAPGLCAIPTNAANNAVFIGAATPVAGTQFYIKNTNSANAVRAKAAGGATINGAVAGGYIALVAGASMHCTYYTVGDLVCDTYSNGSGTTAALPTPAGP